MCRTKIKSVQKFTVLKNCAHVKLVSYKAAKEAAMQDGKQLLSPVAMGDDGTVPTLTIGFLSASRWNACQIIDQRTIFVS